MHNIKPVNTALIAYYSLSVCYRLLLIDHHYSGNYLKESTEKFCGFSVNATLCNPNQH